MPDTAPAQERFAGPLNSANRSLRIGYFGGTFDPPHRGHLAVARAARDHFHLHRVLLAPTGRQPLKPAGPVASWADRLRMTELLCSNEPRLEASSIDSPRPNGEPNYTADTLRRLRTLLDPDSKGLALFAILGADAFEGLPRWREPAEVLRLAEWIVVSRPGCSATMDRTHEVGRAYSVLKLEIPISSTEVRTRLQAGLDCEQFLTAEVLAFIEQRRLY